eukprot:scaffold1822_cov333-Pavlova_lutheri.AAC.4
MLTCSLKKSERRGIPRKGVSILKPSAHEFDEVHNAHHHPGPHLAVRVECQSTGIMGCIREAIDPFVSTVQCSAGAY